VCLQIKAFQYQCVTFAEEAIFIFKKNFEKSKSKHQIDDKKHSITENFV
jgi:hypothetical protein